VYADLLRDVVVSRDDLKLAPVAPAKPVSSATELAALHKELVAFISTLIGVAKNRPEVETAIKAKFGDVARPTRDAARRESGFAGKSGPRKK
jgi:hypothetical protein